MTSDSIDAMPLHRIVTSNDVDMGLKSGQPALRKMLLRVKFWLDFLDFWQVESWLKYPNSGENSFSKYLFAEKLRPRLVMHLYFDVSHDVSVNHVFLAKNRRPSPLRGLRTRVKKFSKLSGSARSIEQNQGYKICSYKKILSGSPNGAQEYINPPHFPIICHTMKIWTNFKLLIELTF